MIDGYPNYRVTPDGVVINLRTGRELRLQTLNGYKSVKLYNDGNWYRFSVHRLVAEEYVDKPAGKNHVNHKDGNPSNNHYTNLEWVTPQENSQHRCEVLKKGVGEKARASKMTEDKVRLMRVMSGEGVSTKELSKGFEIAPQNVRRIVTRKAWKHVV